MKKFSKKTEGFALVMGILFMSHVSATDILTMPSALPAGTSLPSGKSAGSHSAYSLFAPESIEASLAERVKKLGNTDVFDLEESFSI